MQINDILYATALWQKFTKEVIDMTEKKRFVVGEFPVCVEDYYTEMVYAYSTLYRGTGEGGEMTGWLNWPAEYIASAEYERLKNTAKRLQQNSDAVVIVGIGGSYLTPQMVIHSEFGDFYNEVAPKKGLPKIYYAGCDLSPDKLYQTLELLADGDWSIIYISKSGGTMEPALAFRVLWKALCEKYGPDGANERIIAITDAQKGILKNLANQHNWEAFVIPDNIGGRYSGLTACGLLPIAVAGLDTDLLLKGAIAAIDDCKVKDCFALDYAIWRYFCFDFARVEFIAMNDPYLAYLGEWLKQLFGESEGKNNCGIFPASGVFPTDLHSLGQFLQEGTKELIFESFIQRDFSRDMEIPKVNLNDNLDTREGKKFTQAAAAAMDGAFKAHTNGDNLCGIIRVGNGLEAMGYLMQGMFVACAIYCYMMDVNPFNQPGVEQHKQNMKTSPEWDK